MHPTGKALEILDAIDLCQVVEYNDMDSSGTRLLLDSRDSKTGLPRLIAQPTRAPIIDDNASNVYVFKINEQPK